MSDMGSNRSATILPFRKSLVFLAEPMPERIHSVFMLDGQFRTLGLLSIGVILRTHDNIGMRIVPTKEIMFAIGDDKEPERAVFSVGVGMAEAIQQRLIEFIAACKEEGTNESKDKAEEAEGSGHQRSPAPDIG